MWDTPWIEQKTFFLQTVARNLGLFSSLLAGRKSGPPRRLWFSPGWVVGTKPLSTAFLLLPSSFFTFAKSTLSTTEVGRRKRTGDQKKEGGREDRPPPPPKPFGKSGLINLASAAKRGEEGRRKRKRREKRVSLPRAKTFKGLMNDFGYSLSVFLLFIDISKFSN